MGFFTIFFVSFFCILLEIFFTRILNLKAWNHLVYIIIPFAILGYGIGANIQLIWQKKFAKYNSHKFLGWLLILLSFLVVISSVLMIRMPINISYLETLFQSFVPIGMLALSYMVIMIPFIIIGFIVVHLFSRSPKEMYKLYLFDLVGAGIGAAAFFFMIDYFEVFRSILILAIICFYIGVYGVIKRSKIVLVSCCLVSLLGLIFFFHEPSNYYIDNDKSWEDIPGHCRKGTYKELWQKWHPLGRTDIYQITNSHLREQMYDNAPVTFLLNVKPLPEFSYFATNFLSGTPVFNFAALKQPNTPYSVKLFSEDIELPYVLFKKPRVFIIGAGGGRDLFMARTHDARQILAAEINPATYQAMQPGGIMYDYSGHVYGDGTDNTKVHNIDGRYLVKQTKEKSFDLIILNGVDTFSGLSSGAYAYAESYLYTKDAIKDYLRILDDKGIINFNRWLFSEMPRETLRLEAIALEALKESGVKEPWKHIVIVRDYGWSIFLVKKTPFTAEDRSAITSYIQDRQMCMMVYPSEWVEKITSGPLMSFDVYAYLYSQNKHKAFAAIYPYDISVISDDEPFFYKYYKLEGFNPFQVARYHQTGNIIFMTQLIVLLQAIVFIVLFILLPLSLSKRIKLQMLPRAGIKPYIIYFSCLGIGFMLIEISIMQKFVLLLGSPIYSLSVVLAILLIATGVGSGLLPVLKNLFGSYNRLVTGAAVILSGYIFILIATGNIVCDILLPLSLASRIFWVTCILFPMGIILGTFFPCGLQLTEEKYQNVIPWAWGLNCGFSVLGSILAIMVAQFYGFNFVLLSAVIFYLIGSLAFTRMTRELS